LVIDEVIRAEHQWVHLNVNPLVSLRATLTLDCFPNLHKGSVGHLIDVPGVRDAVFPERVGRQGLCPELEAGRSFRIAEKAMPGDSCAHKL
jgi:hypothetical protein